MHMYKCYIWQLMFKRTHSLDTGPLTMPIAAALPSTCEDNDETLKGHWIITSMGMCLVHWPLMFLRDSFLK